MHLPCVYSVTVKCLFTRMLASIQHVKRTHASFSFLFPEEDQQRNGCMAMNCSVIRKVLERVYCSDKEMLMQQSCQGALVALYRILHTTVVSLTKDQYKETRSIGLKEQPVFLSLNHLGLEETLKNVGTQVLYKC